MAYAQRLMAQGSSGAPVQSPLEGVLRALQAPVGGFFQSRVDKEYREKDDAYRQALAQALQGDDPLGSLSQSTDPQLMGLALEGRLQQQLRGPQADPLMKVYDPTTKQEIYKPTSQAAGLPASAPMQPEPPKMREIMQGNQKVFQEFDPSTNSWRNVGQGPAFAPQQPREDPPVEVWDGEKMIYVPRSQAIGMQSKGPPTLKPEDTFKQANTLRDEYNTLTKDFRTVQDAYNKIKSTSDTGAGDMSLLYSYVKLLDPGSVVRESEFATAAASGSFGEQVQGAVQRLMTGERLPDTLRSAFKAESDSIYKAQKLGYDRIRENYKSIAEKNQVDPNDVLIDFATELPGIPGSGALSPDREMELKSIFQIPPVQP